MNHQKLFDLSDSISGVCGLFSVAGSFGVIDGDKTFAHIKQENDCYIYENDTVRLSASFRLQKGGACIREDTLQNLTDHPITITKLSSRFLLEGCDYEVYTQYNNWQHENEGAWQRLNTTAAAINAGIRTCDGATPMMALANRQNQKITVFHLIPNCRWQMTATKRPRRDKQDAVVVECGFAPDGLCLTVAPGETIYFPKIIFLRTEDRLGLGAEQLHDVLRAIYPKRRLPIMYNTWLLEFDNIKIDNIFRQVDAAAALGIEIFVIDAGWFGTRPFWDECIGEWTENTEAGFYGRLREVADYIRSRGMIFGLWLEPERALPDTVAVKEHPDYYFDGRFLDFANEKAREHILTITCELIEKYGIGFFKFDFNASLSYDPSGAGYYRYMEGQRKYVLALREKYPELYISNCASGGQRMDLGQAEIFDSFWLSDNQGPYEGIHIYADGAKRLLPSMIEKWNVQTFCGGFPEYKHPELRMLPISCNNATWDFVLNVKQSFTFGFLTGGPIGFSGNIADFPAEYKKELAEFIANIKQNRDYFATAQMHFLCDTGNLIALEYADPDQTHIMIQLFTKLVFQKDLTVYPFVDESAVYLLGDRQLSGHEIAEDGITFSVLLDNDCQTVELIKI